MGRLQLWQVRGLLLKRENYRRRSGAPSGKDSVPACWEHVAQQGPDLHWARLPAVAGLKLLDLKRERKQLV